MASDPANDQPPPKAENAAAPTWNDFTQNTTIHGVRYIFQTDSYIHRRVLWTLIVLGAVVAFFTQVGLRVQAYYDFETYVDVDVVYVEMLRFPAITLCNQNAFRITEVVHRWDLYHFLDTVFGVSDIADVDLSEFDVGDININTTEFIMSVAHQRDDLIESCTWHSRPCDVQRDFTPILTDLGLCYQFNSEKRKPALTSLESGSRSGLSLVLNVEQYEYMRGPQHDAGVKVLLHDQSDTPLMDDQGFAAAPGSHTLVGIKTKQVLSLEPPYGRCGGDQGPASRCRSRCKARQTAGLCNCSSVHVHVKNMPTCNLTSTFVCLRKAHVTIAQNGTRCKCPVQCNRTVYEPVLSYAHLSRFNLDRLALGDEARRARVESRFRRAAETSQRAVAEIAHHDADAMNALIRVIDAIAWTLNATAPFLQSRSGARFAQHFDVTDIFSEQANSFSSETTRITARTTTVSQLVQASLKTKDDIKALEYFRRVRQYFQIDDGGGSKVLAQMTKCLFWDYHVYGSGGHTSGYSQNDTYTYEYYDDPDSEISCHYVSETFDGDGYVELLYWWTDSGPAAIPALNQLFSVSDQYWTMINTVFSDSYIDISDNEDHVKCVKALDSVQQNLSVIFSDLVTSLETFTTHCGPELSLACWDLTSYVVGNFTLYQSEHVASRVNDLEKCSWVRKKWIKENSNGQGAAIATLSDSARHAVVSVKYHFNRLQKNFDVLHGHFVSKCTRVSKKLQKYVDVRSTKEELAMWLTSRLTENIMLDLSVHLTDMSTTLKNLLETLDSFVSDVKRLYANLLNRNIPLVTSKLLNSSIVGSCLSQGGLVETEPWPSHETPTNAKILIDAMRDCLDRYPEVFNTIVADVVDPVWIFIADLDTLTSGLKVYLSTLQMDQNFLMANFLQLDVFHRELSFERVRQQRAFQVESLLSEVGGFLGLLLGASLLTVFELLDHLIITFGYSRNGQ